MGPRPHTLGTSPAHPGASYFKPASTGPATDYALVYVAYHNDAQGDDLIQALETDGFQAGTALNQQDHTYYYAACAVAGHRRPDPACVDPLFLQPDHRRYRAG